MNSMIFAGGRIHPPDVIGKYAPDSVIGAVGSGVAAAASAAPKAGGGGPIRTASFEPLSLRATNQLPVSSHFRKDTGSKLGNHAAWGHLDGAPNWRVDLDENPGASAPDRVLVILMLTMQTNMLREAVVVASWAVRGCSAVWLVKVSS